MDKSMKKTFFGITLVIFLFAMMPACSGSVSDAGSTNTDPARTIHVKTGEEFSIALPSNATTGYAWEYTTVFVQVFPLATTYVLSTPILTGSGGTDFFRFKAAGAGQVVLHFVYKRPWETSVSDQKDFTVVVS
jgi:inhibitor of cysteine peptidase